ncbi:DUF2946 domain-containing protein [Janthinobacterium sp. Mn2066]|uniref:DUF2946 domain-containing protein n=1 Tax=Janthinobacterium sp. Mn2066 TaxID=3395264 RepID=UPI003BD223C5
MKRFLKRQTLHIWIACFAILLNALAPSMSHAMAAMRGNTSLLDVCTSSGSRLIKVDLAEDPASQAPADSLLHHLEHCPYCASHATPLGMPPASTMPFAVLGGHEVFPSLFYHSPAPLFTWSLSHPRAPPSAT